MKYLVNRSGGSITFNAKKFGVAYATTDLENVLADPEVTTVIIATRHDQHAMLTCKALEAGKQVFVEKPLALTREELDLIVATQARCKGTTVTVGFNRRFSPYIKKAQELLGTSLQPLSVVMTINAGSLPQSHWTKDSQEGGGRIIGEACHFIDLFACISKSLITEVTVVPLGARRDSSADTVQIQCVTANGSIASINYFSNGQKKFPKEQITIFSSGRVLSIENFRSMHGYGFPRFSHTRTLQQDKGNQNEISAFVEFLKHGGPPIIPLESIINSTRATFTAQDSLCSGNSQQI